MSSEEENKQIALSIVEALNTRDLSVWSKHLAEDYTAEHPGVSVPLNKTMSVGYNQRFVTAFPDIHFEVLSVLAEGDYVLIQWTSERHPRRKAGYSHGTDHPPDQAKYDGVGGGACRGEGWQDRTRVELLGSALAFGSVGHHRTTRTLLASRGLLGRPISESAHRWWTGAMPPS